MKRQVCIGALLLMLLAGCAPREKAPRLSRPDGFDERYSLEQVVVLSRHGIRSPLSARGSVVERATPHDWFDWTSPASELSAKGAALEQRMGRHFRDRLVAEGLIPQDWLPREGEVRFYANSLQRTVASATAFAGGLLPAGGVPVEQHYVLGTHDPVFKPQLTVVDSSFLAQASAFVEAAVADEAAQQTLADNYHLLARVLDFDRSPLVAAGDTIRFDTDDIAVRYERLEEPVMEGTLMWACRVADALIMQQYEEPDDRKAAFGYRLSTDGWRRIAAIPARYHEILFDAPAVVSQVTRPVLGLIADELAVPGRKLTFLCAHDVTLQTVLDALQAVPYTLPCSIEPRTPVGSMIVFSRWKDAEGGEWLSLDLTYQTRDQLRKDLPYARKNRPACQAIALEGLQANEDGLYALSDVLGRVGELPPAPAPRRSVSADDPSGFVQLREFVPDVIEDVRYYGTYNFVGCRVDGYEEPVILSTREAAEALERVADELRPKGWRLKVYDAYRPTSAVAHFVRWASDITDTLYRQDFYPTVDKRNLFRDGFIAHKSGHSRGSTFDLTLVDIRTGEDLDVGGWFDMLDPTSYPFYAGVTPGQRANRRFLRDAMLSNGFVPLETEWWHFTLSPEPYPDTYFSFPVRKY